MLNYLEGMLLCLAFQAIIISIFHFRRKNSVEIGFICLILGLGKIYSSYYDVFQTNLLANIFLGDYKSIVIPSLIYLYFIRKSNIEMFTKKLIFNNLIIPITIIVAYTIIKFGFESFYFAHLRSVTLFLWLTCILITLWYLLKGVFILKKIRKQIIEEAYKRFKLLFVLVNIYLMSILLLLLYSSLFLGISVGDEIFSYTLEIAFYLIDFLGTLAILLFSILELNELKHYFSKEKIENKTLSKNKFAIINEFIEKELKNKKIFKDPNLDLRIVLNESKITENDFSLYIKSKYNLTINNYINELRINAFINLVSNSPELLDKYDIISLAKLSGFNSKSTFYRVFKENKGFTPKKFIDEIS